jgi:hypothetical protein
LPVAPYLRVAGSAVLGLAILAICVAAVFVCIVLVVMVGPEALLPSVVIGGPAVYCLVGFGSAFLRWRRQRPTTSPRA